jgi:general L-amino acid transport system substrate-binding protein
MLAAAGLAAMFLSGPGGLPQTPDSRVGAIEKRGHLTCGVEAAVPGFVDTDAGGRHAGLDVDICRAVAAAILGDANRVRFVRVTHVNELAGNPDIDMVARRLTWELRREQPLGLLFGPVTFYDGQGFLVPRALGARTARDLANRAICVAGGPVFELNLGSYFADHTIPLKKVVVESAHAYDDIAAALTDGRCDVYSGDVSDLGVIRQRTTNPAAFAILDELISKEPLAPLVRDDDVRFFNVLRWTVAALIRAEELGVSSANIETMRRSPNLEVQRLLGVVAGNGEALGLRESWAYDAIRQIGNYGEIFDRHVGRGSAIGLDRGLNRLWTEGGLMYAPPLR